MPLNKLHNQYAAALTDELFAEAPKAVIAAVAVSVLTLGGDYLDEAAQRFAAEWQVLYENGIVPQAPGKVARKLAAAASQDA